MIEIIREEAINALNFLIGGESNQTPVDYLLTIEKAILDMQKLEKIEHELYHCDEVAQNECDAYYGRCNQCKVERIEQIVKD